MARGDLAGTVVPRACDDGRVADDERQWLQPVDAGEAYGLDSLPESEWPMVAAQWLADGFDSPQLRVVAGMDRADRGADIAAAMVAALASIGFPVVSSEAFAGRCQTMLDLVAADLRRSGWTEYRFRPVNVVTSVVRVVMYAALVDGSFWSGGSEGMHPRMDDPGLLEAAADSVSDTLAEVERLIWPRCRKHGGRILIPALGDHPRSAGGGVIRAGDLPPGVYWACTKDRELIYSAGPEHLQHVGALDPADVVTRW